MSVLSHSFSRLHPNIILSTPNLVFHLPLNKPLYNSLDSYVATCFLSRFSLSCSYLYITEIKSINQYVISPPRTYHSIFSNKHSAPSWTCRRPRRSKRKIASWVRESLQAYGKFIASDLVDASIKPRIRKIRKSLWSYRDWGILLNSSDAELEMWQVTLHEMVVS